VFREAGIPVLGAATVAATVRLKPSNPDPIIESGPSAFPD
jgi:hypothetical protein